MESIVRNASTIRNILASQGDLSLWEVRAILSQIRDSVQKTLLWMAARNEIVYGLKDQGLCVTLAEAARGGEKT
jgi:hypothetical protein